jgi:hypothetical protein
MKTFDPRRGVFGRAVALLIFALAAAACGNDDDSSSSQATPTVRATNTAVPSVTPSVAPTSTPVQGAVVQGVLVVARDVEAGRGDALGAVPEAFVSEVGADFDRSLAHADWTVEGSDLSGTTGEDGRFVIGGLAPGAHLLNVRKSIGGDLMSFAVPFTVGDDGAAEVIAEVAWGRVRATSLYLSGGAEQREVRAPDGSRLRTSDGRLVELASYAAAIVDEDGDGEFEQEGCGAVPSLCDEAAGCPVGTSCSCTASCPFCDDCFTPVCTVPRGFPPYLCGDDGGCQPGDQCVCVPTAPDSTDCALSVCVPSCGAVTIDAVEIYGTSRMIVGQRTSLGAAVVLSSGGSIDVTALADWSSSDEDVLGVDSWGQIEGRAPGNADLVARVGSYASDPHPVEVAPRPALVRIQLLNSYCDYPFAVPAPGDVFADPPPGAIPGDQFWIPPVCSQAVEIGGTIRFTALGQFEDGYYEEISDEVEWLSTPAGVGDIEGGLFTGRAVGVATVSARLDGITSDTRDVRVVAERSLIAIDVYPDSYYVLDFLADVAGFCPFAGCGGGFATLLVGDTLQYHATARYDIGGWEDVTDSVDWHSSDSEVIGIDAGGLATGIAAGTAAVYATLDAVESNRSDARVVTEATVLSISAYSENPDRVVEKGGQVFFHADAYYDLGFSRDVTQEATWRSSDDSVGGFDAPGVFTGRAAGNVTVSAELDGVRSFELPLEVFAQSQIDYCDEDNINRGTWSDGFNRVYLESDCAEYTAPGVVNLRFTVTETDRPGGIFDPCLDLYAYRDGALVRTIREEGCGEPFLPAGAPEFDDAQLRYQLQAFWDLKDETGNTVAPGTYEIRGVFYLYYDPVVTLQITVE